MSDALKALLRRKRKIPDSLRESTAATRSPSPPPDKRARTSGLNAAMVTQHAAAPAASTSDSDAVAVDMLLDDFGLRTATLSGYRALHNAIVDRAYMDEHTDEGRLVLLVPSPGRGHIRRGNRTYERVFVYAPVNMVVASPLFEYSMLVSVRKSKVGSEYLSLPNASYGNTNTFGMLSVRRAPVTKPLIRYMLTFPASTEGPVSHTLARSAFNDVFPKWSVPHEDVQQTNVQIGMDKARAGANNPWKTSMVRSSAGIAFFEREVRALLAVHPGLVSLLHIVPALGVFRLYIMLMTEPYLLCIRSAVEAELTAVCGVVFPLLDSVTREEIRVPQLSFSAYDRMLLVYDAKARGTPFPEDHVCRRPEVRDAIVLYQGVFEKHLMSIGNSYLTFRQVCRASNDIGRFSGSETAVSAALDTLRYVFRLIDVWTVCLGDDADSVEEDRYQLRVPSHTEHKLATRLLSIMEAPLAPIETTDIERETLADEQLAAVQRSRQVNMLVLNGAPGTGKSYTTRKIGEAHVSLRKPVEPMFTNKAEKVSDKLKLAPDGQTPHRAKLEAIHAMAPTGRAAFNLAQATGMPATTIATMTYSADRSSLTLGTLFNASVRAIVIDEISMVSTSVASKVLCRTFKGAQRVVLAGDSGQLPPVEYGQPMLPIMRYIREHPNASAAIETLTCNHRVTGDTLAVCRDVRARKAPITTLTKRMRPWSAMSPERKHNIFRVTCANAGGGVHQSYSTSTQFINAMVPRLLNHIVPAMLNRVRQFNEGADDKRTVSNDEFHFFTHTNAAARDINCAIKRILQADKIARDARDGDSVDEIHVGDRVMFKKNISRVTDDRFVFPIDSVASGDLTGIQTRQFLFDTGDDASRVFNGLKGRVLRLYTLDVVIRNRNGVRIKAKHLNDRELQQLRKYYSSNDEEDPRPPFTANVTARPLDNSSSRMKTHRTHRYMDIECEDGLTRTVSFARVPKKHIVHAWCTTVHAAQGGTYPGCVVFFLPEVRQPRERKDTGVGIITAPTRSTIDMNKLVYTTLSRAYDTALVVAMDSFDNRIAELVYSPSVEYNSMLYDHLCRRTRRADEPDALPDTVRELLAAINSQKTQLKTASDHPEMFELLEGGAASTSNSNQAPTPMSTVVATQSVNDPFAIAAAHLQDDSALLRRMETLSKLTSQLLTVRATQVCFVVKPPVPRGTVLAEAVVSSALGADDVPDGDVPLAVGALRYLRKALTNVDEARAQLTSDPAMVMVATTRSPARIGGARYSYTLMAVALVMWAPDALLDRARTL